MKDLIYKIIAISGVSYLLLTFWCTVSCAFPNFLNYKGFVVDEFDVPVNGEKEVTFTLYTDEVNGLALWSETQSLTIVNGLLLVQLGGVKTLESNIFENEHIWLGIRVGNDEEMIPRQKITSLSYSFVADKAGSVAEKAVSAAKINAAGEPEDNVLTSQGDQVKWKTPIYAPIGSIIAWAKTRTGTPLLSTDWIECSGLVVSDPESPYNGLVTPNLNGQHNFLRGNQTSGGMGGSATHNHQWLKSVSQTYSSTGSLRTLNTASLDFGAGPIVWKIESESDSYTNKADSQPPFYDVVWIMRIK